MFRCPEVPFLPGNSINFKAEQEHFPKPHFLEIIGKGVTTVSSKVSPNKYPSIYAQGEAIKNPPWLVFDKKVLSFNAYYKESICEKLGYNHIVHYCKIYFYLEDGTIKVVEPKICNSGIPQGCLIKRQRIRFPGDSNSDGFYDILDFNVGNKLEFFGKVFKITDCDAFTRSFLNRLGIPVPNHVPAPEDPYTSQRQKTEMGKRSGSGPKKGKNFLQFMALEGRILSFDAYWDDRETEGGYLHIIKVYYYLCDDAIEMKDITDPSRPIPLVKRCRLPKEFKDFSSCGKNNENITLLNVMGVTIEKSWSIRDPLNLGRDDTEFFSDRDLTIGATVNAYGRRIILTDCDDFTKEYYRAKYGLDDFTPADRPLTKEECETNVPLIKPELPPHNGFGTHEDSAINCRTVNPFSSVKSYKQFLEKDKEGYDSKIFRFSAIIISDVPIDMNRIFTISYYLVDDTINVFETAPRNSGLKGGTLIRRRQIMKPGECVYASKPPLCYRPSDLFVGNLVNFENFKFELVGADEYTLRYMETHSNEFPKSNINLILQKLEKVIRPGYKEFVARYFLGTSLPHVPYIKFRNSLKDVMGNEITEHEILTLARHFSVKHDAKTISLESLKRLTHDELRRQLYNDFDRLQETFLHHDQTRSGRISKDSAYFVLRGARLPLDADLIKFILKQHCQGESCELDYENLLNFLNYRKFPSTSISPISIPGNLSWIQLQTPAHNTGDYVDIEKLISELHLEEELKQQA